MKSFRIFFVTMLVVSGMSISAQNIFIQFYGQVRDLVTQQPVVNHMVLLTLHADTTDVYYYSDIAYTDENGWYSFPASVPKISGISNYISLSSYDCMMEWQKYTILNDGGALAGSETDFEICTNDTIIPGPCENRIIAERQPGRRVTFYGGLYSGEQATCLWNFGDGSTGSGSPVEHTYSYQAIYDVILQTITADSCIDTTNYLLQLMDSLNPSPCKNTITVFREGGVLDVTFVGNLPGAQQGSFYWDFGDGTTATEKIVTHTYAQTGFYNVLLHTITSYGCVDYSGFPLALKDSLNQSEECTNFILPVEIEDLTVSLHGYLYNGMPASCTWSFGDGTSATGQYVTHTYAQPGTYPVSLQTLTADSCLAASGLIISLTDTVSQGCSSYFTYSQWNTPLEIHFQGFTNSIFPTEYFFDFGDPATGINNGSNLQNTSHAYVFPGTYTVTLYTIDSTGCTNEYSIQITVPFSNCDNHISGINIQDMTVTLRGSLNSGLPASFFWDFGDGTFGTDSLVTHTYAIQGTYNVMLTTVTADSCTAFSTITLTVPDPETNDCSSYFSASATNNLYEIHFAGYTESQYPASYLWNFGDPASGTNNTSTEQNPDHTFSAVGTYSVTLTIVDSTNCTSTFSAPVILSLFSNFSLFGQVLAGNQSITACKVQLFSQDYTGSMNMIEEVSPDSANYYKFDSVSSGIYHILAIPDPGTIYALQYLPTYFGDAFLWENSIPVVLGQPANPYHIHLVDFDSISGGDGMITGGLTAGGKSINVGNQEILILDINNIPVKYLFSEADGTFSFAGLPYGEYKVYPVITGIKTYPVTVILSATSPSANVSMKISGQTVAGTGESEQYSLIENLYPNPASDVITVTFKMKGNLKIQIIDATGKIVFIGNEATPADGNVITMPVSALKPGLYLLVVQDEAGNNTTRQFIKN